MVCFVYTMTLWDRSADESRTVCGTRCSWWWSTSCNPIWTASTWWGSCACQRTSTINYIGVLDDHGLVVGLQMLIVRLDDGLQVGELVTRYGLQSEPPIRRVVEETTTLTRRCQFLELIIYGWWYILYSNRPSIGSTVASPVQWRPSSRRYLCHRIDVWSWTPI